jgi:hypothetical protein
MYIALIVSFTSGVRKTLCFHLREILHACIIPRTLQIYLSAICFRYHQSENKKWYAAIAGSKKLLTIWVLRLETWLAHLCDYHHGLKGHYCGR